MEKLMWVGLFTGLFFLALGLHTGFSIINNKLNKIMAKLEEYEAAFAEINEATNNIAADIDRYIGQLASGDLNSEQEAEVLTKLKGVAEQLKAIASKTPETDEEPPVEG